MRSIKAGDRVHSAYPSIIEIAMVYQDSYRIEIYVKGVVADMSLHGPVEYLQAKIFLDAVLQKTYRLEHLPLPIPEPDR